MRADLKSQASLGLGSAEVTITITRPDGAVDELHIPALDIGAEQDSEFNLTSSTKGDDPILSICVPEMDEFALSLRLNGKLGSELFTMSRLQEPDPAPEEPDESVDESIVDEETP